MKNKRVRLPKTDDLSEEFGKIIAVDGDLLTVEVDAVYRDEDDPDGLREVLIEDVEII